MIKGLMIEAIHVSGTKRGHSKKYNMFPGSTDYQTYENWLLLLLPGNHLHSLQLALA